MQITDAARDLIQNFLKQKKAEGLRLYYLGGCGGPQHGFTTDEPEENDRVEIINGIRVAFDPEVGSTDNFTLDMVQDEDGTGLVLLGVPELDTSGGCGCGTSCGCKQ